MELQKIVGNNIQILRKQNNMTQKDLADIFSYTPNAVSKWERGETLPELATLKAISDYFGVSVDCLITEDGANNKEHFLLEKDKRKIRLVQTLLIISLFWTIIVVVFVYLYQNNINRAWTCFVWMVPISALIPTVIYRKESMPILKFILSTTVLWGLLVSVYIQYIELNLFLIFLIGIPAQISIFLWSKIINIKK